MLVRAHARARRRSERATFQFVRHNERNESFFCEIGNEKDALAEIATHSAPLGAKLAVTGNEVEVLTA